MSDKTLHATLIGINAYKQSPLNGCIKDVLDMDLFLRELCLQQGKSKLKYNPKYFLAPDEVDKIRLERYKKEQLPVFKDEQDISMKFDLASFANISQQSFAHLKSAEDGDICLFYYSGHGSQTDAPQEFWHSKPDRQNETIVCMDSRDPENKEARDLIDKELGYLLWDALEGKKVHCVVIMDSCHSGNNTRSLSDNIKYRHVGSSRNKIALEKYIGFDDKRSFYTIENGKASIKIANYIHLAAALDFEKAQESPDGGLFTNKLVEALRDGGTVKTYRDLMQSVGISIHNRVGQQTPIAFSRNDDDLDLKFLSDESITFKPTYEVRFDIDNDKWILFGGAMNGLVATDKHAKTTIQIAGSPEEITVTEVYSNFSVLDEEGMKNFKRDKETYKATIACLANPRLKIGLSKGVLANTNMFDKLKRAYNQNPPLFFTINFDDNNNNPDYRIQLTQENKYVLTGANNMVPLFKREEDPASFLNSIDSTGKWVSTSELKNANTSFQKDDFIFTLEKIEGQKLTQSNLEKVKGEVFRINPDEDLVFSYKDSLQPAFRISIAINPKSKLQSCFIGALYLQSKFGIRHDLIPDGSRLLNNGEAIYIQTVPKGLNSISTTIPLQIDDKFALYNINEVSGFLKVFVSDQKVDLQRFKQPNLELDDEVNQNFRGGDDMELVRSQDNLGQQADWTIFTNKIRIVGPRKEKTLKAGIPADFSAFKVSVPEGFAAKGFAVTGDDLERKFKISKLRSVDGEADKLVSMISPPDSIWGDVLTEDTAFPKGLNPASNNGVMMLELLPETENATITLKDGETILIDTKKPDVNTRSIDDNELEETIIPFAFDEASELWYPLGSSDENGIIHIQQLPAPTPGRLSEAGQPLTRSLGGSIKLFFKKILRRKQPRNTLVLYKFIDDGSWEELTRDTKKMKAELQKKPTGKAILLTHGFTGDTRHIVESLKEITQLPTAVDFVLTYDYENLATPIAKAAEELHADLTKIGFGESGTPSLTILAHSQGGLLSRCLVEQKGGDKYVRKLILVGVASAGSEFATLGSSVLGLLTHALNGPPVFKIVITALSFLLKKLELNPGQTLLDTKPGSDFINGLSLSAIPQGVSYSIIGGDTALLKDYNGDDGFLKKLGKALARKVAFPTLTFTLFKGKENDMVVTLDSMQSIKGFSGAPNLKIVASNHLAYFREKLIQKELIELIEM